MRANHSLVRARGARRAACATLVALVALAGAPTGCGGGGGGSSSGAIGSTSAGAQAQSPLALSASSTSVRAGATLTIEVTARRTIRGVFGGGFELRYDPAVVEYVSLDTTASKLTATRDAAALRGGRTGTLVFGRTKEGAAQPEDVTGAIGRFTFRAKAPGTSAVTLGAPAFVNGAGLDIAMAAPAAIDVAGCRKCC